MRPRWAFCAPNGSVAKIFSFLVGALHRYRGLGLTLGYDWTVTVVDFKGAHYPTSVVLFAVFFYLRYPVSYGDLEEIMAERGVDVDQATQRVDFHPEVTRAFHQELTRLKVMFCGLCCGQDMRGLPFRFGYC